MIKHIVIVGPTASGKTSLSLQLAQRCNGHIIAADSRTVYKGMDIGTAKPTIEDQNEVKHYCLDLVYPNELFTVADFVKHANSAQNTINTEGKIDITVGGSGLFVDGFVYSYTFTPPNTEVRNKYKDWDIVALQKELQNLNIPLPTNFQNKIHLLHALERNGKPLPSKKPLQKDTLYIGISPPKHLLQTQITNRVYEMISSGVEEEVRGLYLRYGADCTAFNGGVYKSLRPFIEQGSGTLETAIADTIKSDTSLAKKQLTWFKRNSDIIWFTSGNEALDWVMSKIDNH